MDLKPREFNLGNWLQMQSSVTKQKKVRHPSLQQKKPVPISSGGKNESNRACPSGLGHSREAGANLSIYPVVARDTVWRAPDTSVER